MQDPFKKLDQFFLDPWVALSTCLVSMAGLFASPAWFGTLAPYFHGACAIGLIYGGSIVFITVLSKGYDWVRQLLSRR